MNAIMGTGGGRGRGACGEEVWKSGEKCGILVGSCVQRDLPPPHRSQGAASGARPLPPPARPEWGPRGGRDRPRPMPRRLPTSRVVPCRVPTDGPAAVLQAGQSSLSAALQPGGGLSPRRSRPRPPPRRSAGARKAGPRGGGGGGPEPLRDLPAQSQDEESEAFDELLGARRLSGLVSRRTQDRLDTRRPAPDTRGTPL